MHVASQSQDHCYNSRHHILIQLYLSLAHVPLFSGKETSSRSVTRDGFMCPLLRPISASTFLKIGHLLSANQGSISREKGWAGKPAVFASGSSEMKQGEGARKGSFT